MNYRSQMNQDQAEWLRGYYGELKGATVTEVYIKYEDGELWPALDVKLPNGNTLHIEVSRDEEGNGPGFLFGLPNPS